MHSGMVFLAPLTADAAQARAPAPQRRPQIQPLAPEPPDPERPDLAPPRGSSAEANIPQSWWAPVKRLCDLMVAVPLLVVMSPLILGFWIAVRMGSAGPGLFWSARVGRGGRLFMMPKLRSMLISAPLQAREVFAQDQDPATPLGRFIRGYSLDELPQLWCVIVGQMSLIGPRPLLPNDPGADARMQFPAALTVRPGVTGLAQVSGRNHVTPRRKARYDAFYARKLGLGLDAAILWRTTVALFFRRGGGVL
jgi:O-antigen biosynthesis protein WbqP